MTARIPKMLHQTYRNADLPGGCAGYVADLQALHPDWTYHFYDDDACAELIADMLPDLLPTYGAADLMPVQRADIFRLAIVYLRGGFYLDIDVEMHRALDPLLEHAAVFPVEVVLDAPTCQRLGHEHAVRVGNYGFGAVPGHPFLRHLLDGIGIASVARTEEDVLETTGPGFVTRAFHGFDQAAPDAKVTLLHAGPRICEICHAPRCQFGEYASHRHMGSWRWAECR